MLRVEPTTYKPPPAPASHPLIAPPLMVMVEEFFAYKPPPSNPLHPLMVPSVISMVELSAYKPQPSSPSHPLMVPPLMVMVEDFFAYKPPPKFTAKHPLIVPPSMINFELSLTKMTPFPSTSQSSILPPSIRTVAPESAITARLHFLITPPYILKTESEPIITTQALSLDFLFCSVTFSYIFAVASSDTVIKATLVSPSIVSFFS